MQVWANIPKIKWGTEQLFSEFQTVSRANALKYEDGLFRSENSFQSFFHWNDNMVSFFFQIKRYKKLDKRTAFSFSLEQYLMSTYYVQTKW